MEKELTRSALILFFLALYVVACHLIGEYVILTNDSADLIYYLQGFEQYGLTYFEPLAAIYFEFVKKFSLLLGVESLLPMFSALIFSCFLFVHRGMNKWILFFWFCSMGLLIALINIRYVVFVGVLLIFSDRIVKWVAIFCHWNFIVLMISHLRKIWVFPIGLVFLFVFVVFQPEGIVFEKITHYVSIEERVYGLAIFVESVVLYCTLRSVYKGVGENTILLHGISLGTIVVAFLGLPVVASRLLTLNILTSMYCLRYHKKIYLSVWSKTGLFIVGLYELYRQLMMLGLLSI